MKLKTKLKKIENNRIIVFSKYQEEPIELLDRYFPKGSRGRKYAMCILAVAFSNGYKAGKEESQSKHKTTKKL